MAIVFPASPSVNETFTEGSITYKWDGDKWIGLGVTPADRLVEGSNSLEIDANNDLVWTGDNVGLNTSSPESKLEVRDSNSQGVIIRSDNTQSTNTNKALRIRNNSADNTFWVSHKGFTQITINDDADYSTNTTNTSNTTNTVLTLSNQNGSDGTGVNNYVGINFSVANGATSTAQLQYVRTGDNSGKFEFKARNTSSNYPNIMTLLSSGNIGIGTNNPSELLHLESGHTKQILKSTNLNTASSVIFDVDNVNTADFLLGQLSGRWNGNDVAYINFEAGADTTNKDDGIITFLTSESGSSPTERLRIKSNGDLKHTGLRTGGGENKLAILVTPSHNTNEEDVIVYQVENESSFNQITFGGGTASYNAATALVFKTASAVDTTGGTERLRITSGGNVRIGDTSVTMSDSNPYFPNAWGAVDGYNKCFTIASSNYATLRFRGDATASAEFTLGVGNATYYMAYDETANVHRLTCSASTGIVSGDLNDTSDEKLKENITPIADGQIDIIKQLRPVNFDWKNGTLKGQSGFIAQEIKAVIPDLVQGEEYVEDDFESVGYSVNTNGLVSHLTKALQEAISKIEDLEQRLSAASL